MFEVDKFDDLILQFYVLKYATCCIRKENIFVELPQYLFSTEQTIIVLYVCF